MALRALVAHMDLVTNQAAVVIVPANVVVDVPLLVLDPVLLDVEDVPRLAQGYAAEDAAVVVPIIALVHVVVVEEDAEIVIN